MGKSITDLSSVTTVGLDLAKHVHIRSGSVWDLRWNSSTKRSRGLTERS
jgi:hypothetical protein